MASRTDEAIGLILAAADDDEVVAEALKTLVPDERFEPRVVEVFEEIVGLLAAAIFTAGSMVSINDSDPSLRTREILVSLRDEPWAGRGPTAD